MDKDISEIVKNYAQVAAWGAGAFYFLVKVVQGYSVIDMSVTVALTRQHSKISQEDYLAVSLALIKGARAGFRLHEAVLFVRQGASEQRVNLSFERFALDKTNKLLSINFDKVSSRVPTLNLAPGETARVATFVKVNRDQPCIVEAFVIGTGFGSLSVGQWRASAVSLPLTKEEKT